MIFATSISPKDINRQRIAINSWQGKVISVNHISEIEILKSYFPNVIFIESNRTAFDVYNKHYIYVYDIIHEAFKFETDSIFILNSDIILAKSDFKTNDFFVPRKINTELDYFNYLSFNSLIAFKRYDKTSDKLEIFQSGNDGFIINRKFLHLIKDNGFVLGQCFWDWWLPFTFVVNKQFTWTFNKPYLIHELHERNHDEKQWIYNLSLFKTAFLDYFNDNDLFAFIIDSTLKNNSRLCNDFDIIL